MDESVGVGGVMGLRLLLILLACCLGELSGEVVLGALFARGSRCQGELLLGAVDEGAGRGSFKCSFKLKL